MKHLSLISLLILGFAAGCGKKTTAQGESASLDELNRALSVVAMKSHTFPPSTNELAAFLQLSGKSMPVAPPGKKLVLDPGKRQFFLVDQ